MKAESSSTPWRYITVTELFNDVKEDIRKFTDNNLIEDVRLLKHIVKCNEDLGERLHMTRSCKLIVENYTAPIPEDLWKIEDMFGTTMERQNIFTGIFGSTIAYLPEEAGLNPSLNEQIRYLGTLPDTTCKTCLGGTQVVAYDQQYFQTVENKRAFPLTLQASVDNLCTPYSSCSSKSGFSVDLMDNEFRFSFPYGEVFLSYLADLQNADGELLVPDHPMLLPFYEWKIKKEVFEDLIINSDVQDIERLLQLAERRLVSAKLDAIDYISGFKAKQLDKMMHKHKTRFNNKWFKPYE